MSTLEGCERHKRLAQCHKGLTLFSSEPRHKRPSSPSTIGILQGGNRSLYNKLGARIHNLIGGSQVTTTKPLQQEQASGRPHKDSQQNTRGKTNPFGEGVDLCLLHRILKNQEIRVDR